jgi:hypothetical protein
VRLGKVTLPFLVALVVAFAGCTPTTPVPLLTGDNPDGDLANGACYTNFASGPLVADPTYGTSIQDFTAGTEPAPVVPVRWPVGYTARQAGSEIEVVNGVGLVVAKTGNRYQIEGGYVGGNPPAFLSCGYVLAK